MEHEGPPLEALTRRLAECPADFTAEPRVGAAGQVQVAAVVGDLIESLFKREAGVKDSGTFFPGIGGILDLMDSLLFNAPIMYLYLRHILT